MNQISVDLTNQEVLQLIADYLGKKYNTQFVTGSLRPCYDSGFGNGNITGYNFTGKTNAK